MIDRTVRAAAPVDDDAGNAARDPLPRFMDEQRSATSDRIEVAARAPRKLAGASRVRTSQPEACKSIEDRLHAFGFSLPSKLAEDGAAAFHGPEEIENPRVRCWLRTS